MGIKIKLERSTLAVVQVYAPNASTDYPAFLEEVEEVLDKATSEADSVVLFGDFNAHVGADSETWNGVIGKYGDADVNENGVQLLDFCAMKGLSIMNTFFQHKDIHKYTWTRPSQGQKSIIDFAVVSSAERGMVQDVRVLRSAELNTDHHLLFAKINLNEDPLPPPKCKSKVLKRIKWESLKDKRVQEKFEKGIRERFEQIPQSPTDVEAEWSCFQAAILASATEACGVKRVGVTNDAKWSSWWKTPGVKEVVREKKIAYKL